MEAEVILEHFTLDGFFLTVPHRHSTCHQSDRSVLSSRPHSRIPVVNMTLSEASVDVVDPSEPGIHQGLSGQPGDMCQVDLPGFVGQCRSCRPFAGEAFLGRGEDERRVSGN